MIELSIAVAGVLLLVSFVGVVEWIYENRVDLLSKEVDQ
jgi:hypothetical protein